MNPVTASRPRAEARVPAKIELIGAG